MSKIICCLIHIAIAGLLLRKGDQDQQPLEVHKGQMFESVERPSEATGRDGDFEEITAIFCAKK